MQKILKKKTHGNHLSVKITETTVSAVKNNPIIKGAMQYTLVLIALRVISLTRVKLSCTLDIVGNSTELIDESMLSTITDGNVCPRL